MKASCVVFRLWLVVLASMGFHEVAAEPHATILVPADYPTIQAAIDAAVNGDTVLVSPGTYVENINFIGKAITVRSDLGPEVTIIDGNQADSVVRFNSGEGDASVLSGFTIQNGNGSNGGGVSIGSASPIVTRNRIINNTACAGAGISVEFASPLIEDNLVRGNAQGGCVGGTGGGGILLQGAGAARIIRNRILQNSMNSASGGGISLFAAGTPKILGNIIAGNSASGDGGGLSFGNSSNATVANNMIVRNSAGQGGGMYWLVPDGNAGPVVVNNTIADNTASFQGSAIFADGFDAGTQVFNNIVRAVSGQVALYCGNFNDLNPPVVAFNDVFAPGGAPYGGICDDMTGQNGNISVNPLFVNPAGGNYHQAPGSPTIEVGTNGAPSLPRRDIDGQPRILDGDGNGIAIVDMGADEFRVPGRDR
jgi:hypothetical protein